MSTALILVGFTVFVLGLIALIRGRLGWAPDQHPQNSRPRHGRRLRRPAHRRRAIPHTHTRGHRAPRRPDHDPHSRVDQHARRDDTTEHPTPDDTGTVIAVTGPSRTGPDHHHRGAAHHPDGGADDTNDTGGARTRRCATTGPNDPAGCAASTSCGHDCPTRTTTRRRRRRRRRKLRTGLLPQLLRRLRPRPSSSTHRPTRSNRALPGRHLQLQPTPQRNLLRPWWRRRVPLTPRQTPGCTAGATNAPTTLTQTCRSAVELAQGLVHVRQRGILGVDPLQFLAGLALLALREVDQRPLVPGPVTHIR